MIWTRRYQRSEHGPRPFVIGIALGGTTCLLLGAAWYLLFGTTGTTRSNTPPTVTRQNPANGATGIATTTSVTATFNTALDPTSLTSSTFTLQAGSSIVPAAVSYNGDTATATLTPNSFLANSTSYEATLFGGAMDPRIKDVAGNPLASKVSWTFTTAAANDCGQAGNPIVCENSQPGNPPSEWSITDAGDRSIQGFPTDISVNRGGTIHFKIDTDATTYRLDIYRIGYYRGMGARKMATVLPSTTLPQYQPPCLTDASTHLTDCGNWAVSASWTIPPDATSGIYLAKLVRQDTGGASHILFIVRNDASTSDLVVQTADTAWQAYNHGYGRGLYGMPPCWESCRAFKVSYNRPILTGAVTPQAWFFATEYPMVRWLEANGYDVSYISGVDTDRLDPSLIRRHKVFLAMGLNEYWSGQQRANVEAARAAGVHLGFFTGTEIFWKTRWEPSIDGSSTPHRTLVCYKETHAHAKIDPLPTVWTGTWRDPRFSPPADGGRPENALSGTLSMVNAVRHDAITVPPAYRALRFWRNTEIATLPAHAVATLPEGTLGVEWNEDLDNGSRPAGLIRLSSTTVELKGKYYLKDYGSTYGPGTATHALTLYRHGSGALVFSAGTMQWSWGLDGNHTTKFVWNPPGFNRVSPAADVRMQQATVNLLADMGVQPGSLQASLVAATASTDFIPPTVTIESPAPGSTVHAAIPVTIAGAAFDAGGGVVAAVELSMDGGATWHPATGTAPWAYRWTPTSPGHTVIQARAVDDSANLGRPVSVPLTVLVAPRT